MKVRVKFEENGDEYSGYLFIKCVSFKKIDDNTIKVNGALIEIDEKIIEIKELKSE